MRAYRVRHCFRIILALALLALPAAASTWRDIQPIDYSKIKKSNLPAVAVVRIEVVVKVYENGEEVGSVGLKPGVKLRVVDIDARGILEVRFSGAKAFVDHAATDFVERLGEK